MPPASLGVVHQRFLPLRLFGWDHVGDVFLVDRDGMRVAVKPDADQAVLAHSCDVACQFYRVAERNLSHAMEMGLAGGSAR